MPLVQKGRSGMTVVLSAQTHVKTIIPHLSAQLCVWLGASVLKDWWTILEHAWMLQTAPVSLLNNYTCMTQLCIYRLIHNIIYKTHCVVLIHLVLHTLWIQVDAFNSIITVEVHKSFDCKCCCCFKKFPSLYYRPVFRRKGVEWLRFCLPRHVCHLWPLVSLPRCVCGWVLLSWRLGGQFWDMRKCFRLSTSW